MELFILRMTFCAILIFHQAPVWFSLYVCARNDPRWPFCSHGSQVQMAEILPWGPIISIDHGGVTWGDNY